MPEVTYTTKMDVPVERVWAFVGDMNNWAPMLTGYQAHEIKDERRSVWTLRGDVGILSRTVRLDVNITEWAGPERVSFTLKGLNEAVEGDGTFEMCPAAEATASLPVSVGPPRGVFRRFLDWLFRALFRKTQGEIAAPPERARTAGPGSVLTFRLRMDAGGPTAPLVNAMLEPALQPATEHLANQIAAHLQRAERS